MSMWISFGLRFTALKNISRLCCFINGKASKPFGHDIEELYAAVQPLAPELLITQFEKPANMPAGMWRNESVADFIRRLYHDGQAHNRYLLFGYVRNAEDLFKLDQVVLSVRRLVQPLEARDVGDEGDEDLPKDSIRESLGKRPGKHVSLQCKLEETMEGKRGPELKHALLNWNFPLVGNDYKHEMTTFTSASQNPMLMIRIYDPLECGQSEFKSGDKLWAWVKSNIKLPPKLVQEMEAESEAIKARTIARERGQVLELRSLADQRAHLAHTTHCSQGITISNSPAK
jgi:hypothetical protein